MQFIDQKAIVYTDVRYFAESLHKKRPLEAFSTLIMIMLLLVHHLLLLLHNK